MGRELVRGRVSQEQHDSQIPTTSKGLLVSYPPDTVPHVCKELEDRTPVVPMNSPCDHHIDPASENIPVEERISHQLSNI